jgi:hypothetical protein
MTLHAIPVELANGTAGVFSSVANVAQTVNMLFGGANRGKPISYEAIHGEMMRQAFPTPVREQEMAHEPHLASEPDAREAEIPVETTSDQVGESAVPENGPEQESDGERSGPDLSMF